MIVSWFKIPFTLKYFQSRNLMVKNAVRSSFVFFGGAGGTLYLWHVASQGLNLHHSNDLGCCSDNARSLSHHTPRELQTLSFFNFRNIWWIVYFTESLTLKMNPSNEHLLPWVILKAICFTSQNYRFSYWTCTCHFSISLSHTLDASCQWN